MHNVGAIILDLDNTLYDWVGFFSEATSAMVEVAARHLKTEPDALRAELKVVHQHYGDSEYPYALLETASAVARWSSDRARAKRELQPAFDAFNAIRDRELRLYPGTLGAIEHIERTGCPVIAHTEASVVNAAFRLRKLSVFHHLTRLYALEHHGMDHPEPGRNDPVRLGTEMVRILPRSQRKPDARVLEAICDEEKLRPHEVVYVGDSISRDIGMAKAAGCWAAWAKYGTAFSADAWQRLVGISHWTANDVARAEKAQREFGTVVPDAVLDSSLADVFKYFDFRRELRRT